MYGNTLPGAVVDGAIGDGGGVDNTAGSGFRPETAERGASSAKAPGPVSDLERFWRMSAARDDVRAFALSLPETSEQFTWGMPTFRVAGKLFLTLPESETSAAVRCPIIDRDELVAAEPDKFWIAAHEANNAWVRVCLAAIDDRDELEAIVLDSWRQAAPRHLIQ